MKKLYILPIILVAVLTIFVTGCSKGTETQTYESITGEEALARMETETEYVILDVRTPEEYNEGHIPDAINIPVETITEQPAELDDTEQLIFVYCRSGNRSKQASEKLVELGFSNIVEIGGLNTWTGDIEK